MTGVTVELWFKDVETEVRFLRSYLVDAWERFETSEYWDHGWFWRYGQFSDYDAGPDGGFVRLVLECDPETLIETESPYWESFEGLERWDWQRYDDPATDAETFDSLLDQQHQAKGSLGGDREYRFKRLISRFALAYYQEFDEPLPAAPKRGTADNPLGIGMWALLHDLLVQCGYNQFDETEIAVRMLQNRLKSIAGYYGEDAAREEYDRIRAAWLDYEDEFDSWLQDTETGTMTVK
jgi:hypothetical protein